MSQIIILDLTLSRKYLKNPRTIIIIHEYQLLISVSYNILPIASNKVVIMSLITLVSQYVIPMGVITLMTI